jgi:hypothetical protein
MRKESEHEESRNPRLRVVSAWIGAVVPTFAVSSCAWLVAADLSADHLGGDDSGRAADGGAGDDLSLPAEGGNGVIPSSTPVEGLPDGWACAPLALCNGQCVDTTGDPLNCGGCGLVCAVENAICLAGACVCAPGFHECADVCYADDDVTHCGSSCTACAFPEYAVSSACVDADCVVTCSPSYTLCDAYEPTAECVLLAGSPGDPFHCGSCDNICAGADAGTALCVDGACQ